VNSATGATLVLVDVFPMDNNGAAEPPDAVSGIDYRESVRVPSLGPAQI
jgi:hypothetical protein